MNYYDKKTDLVKSTQKRCLIYIRLFQRRRNVAIRRKQMLCRTLTEARANYGKEQMTLAFEQLRKT